MGFEEFFTALARDGTAPVKDWPADEDPGSYGLRERGGRLEPAAPFDPLMPDEIRKAMTGRAQDWVRELVVHPVIGSTNAEVSARAREAAIDGVVHLAEVQVQGRGRRGRSWSSPFGANLAVSLGVAVDREPSELGGISLVVGLAVLDALEQLGVSQAALKWPNDVLVDGAKLGGILIEMVQIRGTELVIGVGLNVALPPSVKAKLPGQVADLSRMAEPPARNRLAGRVISSVVEFAGEFDRLGFEPFQAVFNERHYYQGRACQVLQEDRRIHGTVAGVDSHGQLILETPEGLRTFHGGEVSLRL